MKQILNFKILLVGIALLLTSVTTQMWADNHTGHHIITPHIYYYNSEGWTNCGFLYGRTWDKWNHTCLESLSVLANTEKLFYDHLDANWGDDYNQFAIVDASGWSCEDNNIEARWGSVSHTGSKVDYDFDKDNTYYITYTSSAPTPTYKSDGHAGIPKFATTLNIKVKESGAGSYSNGSTSDKPASTIKITGTHLSAQGTTSRSDAEWSDGYSCSYNTVISGKVTPSYSSKNDDWQFDGWYVGSTKQSPYTSYDFYQYAATTIEARFTRIKYTVNFNQQSGSGGTTSIKATYGSAMPSITLPTRAGYDFKGYFTEENGSGTKYYNADGTSAKNSDLNATSGTTLYAYWLPQSLTITAHPTYLSTTDKLTLSISYENIPTGYCYRVKVGAGYYNNSSDQDRDAISGTGSTTFTSFSALPLGANTVVVELWKNDPFAAQSVVSNSVTVTVENRYFVNVRAYTDGIESTAGGTVSPESLYATAHLGQTITASAPNVGYNFTGWTADTDNITFADESALSTTVYAAAGGWVRANYVRQSGSYSTTFYAGDHGSIRVIDTDIAKNGNATVTTGENETLSATPEEGYIFDHWGTTGSVTVTDIYAASTTVTAIAAGGTVTAYYRHRPELGAVTATPSGQQNYAGAPIDFALSVTSTYMAHPVVVFLVNDGTTTYEVVGAPYGADGSSAAGTIGSDAANTTVHKATFTASAAKTYTVSAKLYEGELMDNFEGENTRGWAGDNLGTGFISFADNPGKMAGNGSNKVLQVTRTSGQEWGGAIMLFVANTTEAKTTCDAAGSNDYAYIHARMKDATDATHLKNNDNASDGNNGDLTPSFVGVTSSDWRHVTYHNTHCSNNFLFFMIQRGNTENKTVYIDDIILSNEETMTVKASETATASFSINWNYTVTLNNNGATSAGTTSVDVTYGSALSDITVPTKTGYTFYGYYTADGGAGTLQIDASGVWQDGGYVSGGTWHSGSNQTLYAKWGKDPSLTGLALSTSLVTTGNTFTATPTIDAGDGRDVIVCWEVQTDAGVALAPQPSISPEEGNVVTITAPAAPGSYKVVATLKEGTGCEGTVLNSLQQSFTVEGHYTVTITNGTGSDYVGEVTTATATANPAAAGMKFDHWTVVSGTMTSGDVNSRTITFNASSNITLTAVYTERDTKTVYFARPSSWTEGLKVYAWEEASKDGGGNPSNKNAAWPGEACTSTTTIEGTTYYYYTFYIDDNGEGDDRTAQNSWDKIIFNDDGNDSEKTEDLTLVDGHFYHIKDNTGQNGRPTATASGSASAEDWYVCGRWDVSDHDWGFTHPIDLNGNTSGNVVVGDLTADSKQEFMIYRASTDEWFKYTGDYGEYNAEYAAVIGTPMTLHTISGSNSGNNTFTSYATEYRFSLDITSTSNPVLTLAPNDNTPYSATLSKNGNGSLSVGTGAITLQQYIPTTITATPEPGYRFTGWTTTGSVAYAGGTSSSDATASFTASDNGGTITANFSNENIIYFDRSAVVGVWSGNDVYVTFFTNNEHWVEYWEGDVRKERVKMQYCVDGLMSRKMDRIPKTNIYYLYTGGDATQWYMFTDKNMVDGGTTWEQAAVARGDYSSASGNNLFVVENYVEKTVAKTGFYYGYWMKYNQTTPGIKLCIYDGSSAHISGSPFDFSALEAGGTEFTVKIALSENTTYAMELKGDNGIYYKNKGTMISSNSSNWSYVEREATRGHITTTAGGAGNEYEFTLTCADKLTLSAEYPLQVGDYRIVYQGKVKQGGSVVSHPSRVIRQLSGGATERKDTVSFFVTEDWSIRLQKCTDISPITWADACESPTISAATLGLSGQTGVYVFPLTLNNTGADCDQITVGTPVLYTGNYYIRTDVAKGGWEAYKKASDNKMIFSEYARDHSGYDYYHCHWTPTDKSVQFTIANDYSECITDTVNNDDIVNRTAPNEGKLPYQASVRFMYNSAKNTISRAYLNGSSETGANTFLYLQSTSNGSEADIYKADGSALVNDTIRFKDHNNWIYQIDIKANEQARVKLISNYRFYEYDHYQYFKGAAGDWSEATTSEIIGGDYEEHSDAKHDLRIIYDFKTNHLLSAWLVPESGTVPAAAINTDVMIIKQNQNDARQITFSSGSDALTKVDTVYTAVLLTKDFLTGVGSEYAKQFYWLSFPYTVKINDIFGSVGTYGYDWILQRYNGKKRAANGFWIDSEPNWEFMDKSETLNPYEGYILTLDLSEFTSSSEKWGNSVTTLSLYFPSDGKVGNIKQTDVTVDYDQTGYLCPHTRDRRDIKDSYWRCIGSPSFAENTIGGWNTHDNTDDTWKTDNLPFLYEWNSTTNQLSPVAAGDYNFKPLTGYMVQYSGTSLSWTNVITPSASAPRRAEMDNEERLYRLHLVQGEEEVDHTYVRFTADDQITEAFEFNQDLSKEFKSGANIYTLTSDQIQVAGNTLPISEQTTIVPVGVKIKTAGDYTFSIPEGTDGIGITLVDNETGVRTLLSALDYTIHLEAGTYDQRFILEISPIYNTPTGLEGPTSNSSLKGRAQKVMVDGILYIVRDGKIFDARGAHVE